MEEPVITLHKLNGDAVVVNADLIETIEATPDTLVTLVDRRRFMVGEAVEDVVRLVLEYRRAVGAVALAPSAAAVIRDLASVSPRATSKTEYGRS
jgi:flagellar protein FlbD